MLWFRRWFERSGIHCPIRHVGRAIQMRAMPSMPHYLPLFSSLIYIVSEEMSIHQQHHFLKGIRFSVCTRLGIAICNGPAEKTLRGMILIC